MKTLSPEEAANVIRLMQLGVRPKSIVAAKAAFDADLAAAEKRQEETGVINSTDTERLLSMRLEIDVLYDKWGRGELADDELIPIDP